VIRWLKLALVLGSVLFLLVHSGRISAQTVQRERETVITGPRGRSVDRRIEVERGPGTYQRQLQIQRPGGTLQRNYTLERVPRVAGGFVPRTGTIIQRNVFVSPRPSSSWSFGLMAAPILTFPFWPPAPPLPTVVAGPPIVIAPRPGMVAPQVPSAQPSPLDPVALAAQRLQSHHASSRKEGAQTLGRLGDPRAVPPLVYALKYDSSKDVKMAAATALGNLGGAEAEVVLERCIIYEKKEEVRDAAAVSLDHLRRHKDAMASSARPDHDHDEGRSQPQVPRLSPAPPSSRSTPFRPRPRPMNPPLDGPGPEGEGQPSDGERIPPPPPTPVQPPSNASP
jgi:HEAT repeats